MFRSLRNIFISPYINRFLQPDTIIPDFFNPQTWNRFSYVGNNPVRYTDPSGHCRIDDDPDDCFRPGFNNPPSYAEQLAEYEITVDSRMDKTEVKNILSAAITVGSKFAEERGQDESAAEAFTAVYDPLEFVKLDSFMYDGVERNAGCLTEGNTITCADFTYPRPQSSVINIIHELGHVFDPGSGIPDIFVVNRSNILHNNSTVQWQANTAFTPGETFGDFFVAWVYEVWGPQADVVFPGYEVHGSPRSWMDANMTTWLRP